MGLFTALGVDPRNVVFSSDTSEEQGRQFGKGRGTVDCCYPVKCATGSGVGVHDTGMSDSSGPSPPRTSAPPRPAT